MRRNVWIRNFIISLLVLIFVLTAAGYGLDEERQVFSAIQSEQVSELSVVTLSVNGEFHIFQVKECSSTIMRYYGTQSKVLTSSLKGVFSFLCVLIILLVYFQFIKNLFVRFQRLYVKERFYTIFYIQDEDGRKRFS